MAIDPNNTIKLSRSCQTLWNKQTNDIHLSNGPMVIFFGLKIENNRSLGVEKHEKLTTPTELPNLTIKKC